MEMPGRKYNPQGYRYGFNGKENDRSGEWGLGLVQDYGFRLYNPGLGRFLSVDPLRESYPWYTPYQFAGNKPIVAIDLDGAEEEYKISVYQSMSTMSAAMDAGLSKQEAIGVYKKTLEQHKGFAGLENNKPAAILFFGAIAIPIGIAMGPEVVAALLIRGATLMNPSTLTSAVTGGSLAYGLAAPMGAPDLPDNPFDDLGRVARSAVAPWVLKSLEVFKYKTGIEVSRNALSGRLRNAVGETILEFTAFSGKKTGGKGGSLPTIPLNQRLFKFTEDRRAYDTETKMFETVALVLSKGKAKAGEVYKDVRATLEFTSQLKVCDSCEDVMSQFKKMFPNVNIKVTSSGAGSMEQYNNKKY
jgi:RHS repeat-associated protein